MATMIPNLSIDQIKAIDSKAEQRFYQACSSQLPNEYLVLHSVNFVTLLSGRPRDGEADFVIIYPNKGIIVVEVKGGGISYEPSEGQWYSENRDGKHEIKNPFEQGKIEKHSILKIMQRYPEWRQSNFQKVIVGHAVFFSDLSVSRLGQLVMLEAPREIIGGEQNLENIKEWIDKVFNHLVGNDNFYPIDKAGMKFLDELFCKSRSVKPLLSHLLRDEEKERIILTEQQKRYLRALGETKRAAITGGAGTGKTLLAMHKAQELAEQGKNTLLVCFNAALGDHLKDVAGLKLKDHLHPMDFQELCVWRIRNVYSMTGKNLEEEAISEYPTESYQHVQLPYALALSVDYLPDEQYDAIIVDEGQDFRADYWMGLEMLLNDDGYLYVFYDPNQAIYQSEDHIKHLMPGEYHLPLTINCRNTKFIHEASYHFYKGPKVDPPTIEGEPIQPLSDETVDDQKEKIHKLVSKFIADDDVPPNNIVILIAGEKLEEYANFLLHLTLPKGIRYSKKEHRVKDTVLIESVGRFKGLEAEIIILWGIDDFDPENDCEILYVAFSRAKSRVFIAGKEATFHKVTEARA